MKKIGKKIIQSAASGNVDDFRKIYDAFSGFVYNVSLRMTESKEDAEEISQEVFLKIHRRLGEFSFSSSLKTWIYRITINTALNFLKAKINKREKDKSLEVEEVFENTMAHFDQADNKVENQDTLNKLLSKLSPDERMFIVLRNIEGLSYAEIADCLNLNINTVRTKLKRVREKLVAIRQEEICDEMCHS